MPFPCRYFTTVGDRDRTTSLRFLRKCDFFTRELDAALIRGEIDAAIHSAKDLPDPLPHGLAVVAITKGVDPRDALVYNAELYPYWLKSSLLGGAKTSGFNDRKESCINSIQLSLRSLNRESFRASPKGYFSTNRGIQPGALIATSSQRREEAVRQLFPHVRFCDIRGTIEERLAQLDRGEVQGVVIAEAALLRLKLNRKRLHLPGETVPLQGRLAVVARRGDLRVKAFFQRYHDPESGVNP